MDSNDPRTEGDRPRTVHIDASGRGHVIVGEGTTIIHQPGNESEYVNTTDESTSTLQPTGNGSNYCVTGKLPFYTGKSWNPEPGRVITASTNKDPTKKTSRVSELFFKDVDNFLQSLSKLTGDARDNQEQFLLQEILPLLEESCLKDDFRAIETYMILAKLSCNCTDSPTVIKHAQQLLLHLICKASTTSCNAHIKKVEKILRGPLIQANSVFTDAGPEQQMCRLTVYSRVLALMVVYIEQEYLLRETIAEEDLKELGVVIDKLTKLSSATAYRKKGQLRYAVEFIQEAIGRILTNKKRSTNTKAYLNECERLTKPNADNTQEIGFLCQINQAKMNWFDLHLLLLYIHNQAIQNPKQAIKAIRRVQFAHLYKGDEFKKDVREDWKFFLLMSTILTDMAMTGGKKEIRTEAGFCMIHLLSIEEIKKTQASRLILEHHASRIVFSPDLITRKAVVYNLYWREREYIPCHVLLEFLGWYYKNQSLELRKVKSQRKSESSVIIAGVFRGNEASIKILRATSKDTVDYKVKEHHQKFITEAFNLRRLSPHANIPTLLAYDTENLPYHIITDLEARGNLLDFLTGIRDEGSVAVSIDLLQMCLDITGALFHLKKKNTVHRAVMARNVLVGKDFTCKLSSLDFARPLEPHEDSDGTYSYCSVDETHEFVSRDPEAIAVRWAAPECLQPPRHFTTASDVWAFAVTMYEIFTFGCEPYTRTRECRSLDCDQDVIDYVNKGGHPPKEVRFEDAVYSLMESCWSMDRNKRPELDSIKCTLQEIQQEYKLSGKKATLLASPPPLKNATTASNSSFPILFEPGVSTGNFGELPVNLASDRPMPANCWKRGPVAVESIAYRGNTHLQHLQELHKLENDYLCKVLEVSQSGSTIQVISAAPSMGSLKDYVTNNRCSETDLIRYLSQVASAMEYLHHNNIVHGDLRADNIAVTSHMEVKVSRFGRSYRARLPRLTEPAEDIYSSICDYELPEDLSPVYDTAEGRFYCDAVRWCAPEVIADNHYSHASDVWAFGVLAWETLAAAATSGDEPGTRQTVPYMDIEDDQILDYLGQGERLAQPDNCPDWFYCVMHQCWPYKRLQRPPFIAIADCLTSSKPMKSWMMEVWFKQHTEDLSIQVADVTQPEGAIHVRADELHPTEDKIRSMCSREFLEDHTYTYTRPYFDEHPYELVYEETYVSIDLGTLSARAAILPESHDVRLPLEAREYEVPSEHGSGYEHPYDTKEWFRRKSALRVPTRRRRRSSTHPYGVTILGGEPYETPVATPTYSGSYLEPTKHEGYYKNITGVRRKPIPAPRTKFAHNYDDVLPYPEDVGESNEEMNVQQETFLHDSTETPSGDVGSAESGEDKWTSGEDVNYEEPPVVICTDVSMSGSFTQAEVHPFSRSLAYDHLPYYSRNDALENCDHYSTPRAASSGVSMSGSFTEADVHPCRRRLTDDNLPHFGLKDRLENCDHYSTPRVPRFSVQTMITEAGRGKKEEADRTGGCRDRTTPLDHLPGQHYENTAGPSSTKRETHVHSKRHHHNFSRHIGHQEPITEELSSDQPLQIDNVAKEERKENRCRETEHDAETDRKRCKCNDGHDGPTTFQNQMYFCENVLCFTLHETSTTDDLVEAQDFHELEERIDNLAEPDCVIPDRLSGAFVTEVELQDCLLDEALPKPDAPQNKCGMYALSCAKLDKSSVVLLTHL